MAYDYAKLLGIMREKGHTQKTLSAAIGISECSLNLTLNNKRDFRQDEIIAACDALHIPIERVDEYFFAPKVCRGGCP